MVTVPTTEQFAELNAKVDQILAAVQAQGRMIQEDWQEFREFRTEVNQRLGGIERDIKDLRGEVQELQTAVGALSEGVPV